MAFGLIGRVVQDRWTGEQARKDTRQQRIGAQTIGTVVVVVAFADRIQTFDIGHVVLRVRPLPSHHRRCERNRPTVHPCCSEQLGRFASVRRVDRHLGTSRRFPESRQVCDQVPIWGYGSGPNRRSSDPFRYSAHHSRRCQRSLVSRYHAGPNFRIPGIAVPRSNSVRHREYREAARGSCGFFGTQTRPPSPRADSLISRNLSLPGIAVGWT